MRPFSEDWKFVAIYSILVAIFLLAVGYYGNEARQRFMDDCRAKGGEISETLSGDATCQTIVVGRNE